MDKINEDELKDLIINLFNAYNYEIKNTSPQYNYQYFKFELSKDDKKFNIFVNRKNNFLKLESNLDLDLEKKPKSTYYINYNDIIFLSRSNRLKNLIND